MRLTLLLTSPRVAPGLLSWAGWSAVAAASRRAASSADLPLARAVTAAGHDVEVLPEATGRALVAAARAGDSGSAGHLLWLADDAEAERLPGELAGLLVDDRDCLAS